MTTEQALTVSEPGAALAEQVIIKGDLARLSEAERMHYYTEVCRSLGLNPLTRPFEYINLNGKLTLYATRACGDQLRAIRGITITSLDPRQVGDLYVVVATGRDRTGREDSSTGAVSIKGLNGEALANAMMKAETKSKRRLTLSLAGLGWSDETEVAELGTPVPPPAPRPSLAAVAAERRAAVVAIREDAELNTAGGHEHSGELVEPIEAPSVEAFPVAGGCGWSLQLKDKTLVPCTLGEMHAGEHTFTKLAIESGGRVVRSD